MQQYYSTNKSHILTAFHTAEGSVSLDIEHIGTVQLHETEKLEQLRDGEIDELEIDHERTSDSALLSIGDEGELVFDLEGSSYMGERDTTVTLTSKQVDTLIDSLGEGDDSVGYAVEGVGQD